MKAKHCVLSVDTDGVLHALNDVADNIELLTSTLVRMHGKASGTWPAGLKQKPAIVLSLS